MSLSDWRSRIQITSPIFRFYQTAHITCFHLPLPLKHCDNAEVDKATCTASSASTYLQTESIQDKIGVPYFVKCFNIQYIFSRFLEWLIWCVGKMLWIWLKFAKQLSIAVEENVVVCACVSRLIVLGKLTACVFFKKQPVALWEKALRMDIPSRSQNSRLNRDPGIPLGSR